MYQFGRKDPFPGLASIGLDAKEKALYNAFGSQLPSLQTQDFTGTATMSDAVANPMIFITNSTSTTTTGNWTNQNVAASIVWNDPNAAAGSKSLFDPCPVGWKVPERTDWTNTGWSVYADNGSVNELYGGYYMATGCRTAGTATLSNKNAEYGYYWAVEPHTNTDLGYNLLLDQLGDNTPYPANASSRGRGFNVRCIKETI